MYEQDKIAEAEYFLSQMLTQIDNVQAFKFNLSAFLTATRSVLQFALLNAQKIKGGQSWYDSWMSKNIYFSYFKDLRDVNIHVKPILISNSVTISPATVSVRISVNPPTIIILDADGRIISSETALPSQEPIRRDDVVLPQTTAVNYYSFDDWSDDTQAEILAQKYLEDLKNFVSEGVIKGFLIP